MALTKQLLTVMTILWWNGTSKTQKLVTEGIGKGLSILQNVLRLNLTIFEEYGNYDVRETGVQNQFALNNVSKTRLAHGFYGKKEG